MKESKGKVTAGDEHIDAIPLQKAKRKGPFVPLAEAVVHRFPDLRRKLKLADMRDDPVDFAETVVKSTLIVSIILIILTYLLLLDPLQSSIKTGIGMFVLMALAPLLIIPAVVFSYFMMYPDAAVSRRKSEMDYEIVFAGRHIVIALQSGMPLFDTFVGTSSGYGAVGKEISKVRDKVVIGMSMAQAIKEVAQDNPSAYFMRMMLQISNALGSGSDVGNSLGSVLEQISKEQMISLKEYSQKLTPLVMFYMIFGIIVPSLGIVLITVILSAISGGSMGFSSALLVMAFVIIAIVQFIFLGAIESSRPKYLL